MSRLSLLLVIAATLTLAVVGLSVLTRRRRDALIQLVRLVPPCLALLRDVMRDPAVPCRAKIAPALVVAYLAMPIDLIPDFLPGLGHLDDAVLVAWAIRHLIASAGHDRATATGLATPERSSASCDSPASPPPPHQRRIPEPKNANRLTVHHPPLGGWVRA